MKSRALERRVISIIRESNGYGRSFEKAFTQYSRKALQTIAHHILNPPPTGSLDSLHQALRIGCFMLSLCAIVSRRGRAARAYGEASIQSHTSIRPDYTQEREVAVFI